MSRTIKVSGIMLLAIALCALMGPWLSPHEYLTTDFDRLLLPPRLADLHVFERNFLLLAVRPNNERRLGGQIEECTNCFAGALART